MGRQLLASKVVTYEEEPKLRSLPASPTAVIGVVGPTKKGPLERTFITSWEEFVKIFGGHYADSEVSLNIWMTYKQDPGSQMWIKRLVHYTDPSDEGTKASVQANYMIPSVATAASAGEVTGNEQATFALEPAQTLEIHIDEDAGGPDTITFNATASTLTGGATSLPASTGDTIVFNSDAYPEDQTITFTGDHTTIELVAQDINEQARGFRAVVVGGSTINFESDTRGTNSLMAIISGTGTALADIGHSVDAGTAGTGNVGDIARVTFAEAESLIEAGVTNPVTGCVVTQESTGEITITSGTTGAGSSVQIESGSTATGFGFDNDLHSGSSTASVDSLQVLGKYDGTYAHDLRVNIENATNGEDDYFNVIVKDTDGKIIESFPNVQNITTTDDDFVETVVGAENTGSYEIAFVDQGNTIRPANGIYTMTSGDDGLTLLDDNDYVGSSSGETGFHGFDDVNNISILISPGRATQNVHEGMVEYCETYRDETIFPILDCPANYSYTQMVTYMKSTTNLKGLSEFGAMYWPRIKVLNPSKAIYGQDEEIYCYPSGPVAGVYSKIDNSKPGGIYEPPAGVIIGRIDGARGFEFEQVKKESVRDVVYPEYINPITTQEGFAIYIDGVYTLDITGNFPTIAERRGVIYIRKQIKLLLEYARHRNIDEALLQFTERSAEFFLETQMKLGAFASKNPELAYRVDFSEALNPPSERRQFKLNGRIGLATQKPAEFIVVGFYQDNSKLLEELGE